MARIAIVTDSTSDLSTEIRALRGVTVVPLIVHFGTESFRDRIDITPSAFYERLQTSADLPTTSQPSPAAFEEAFKSLAREYDEIVTVVISSKLSGTMQSASIAAANVADLIHVEVVDSRHASLGLGFQVLAAADMADAGLGAVEIASRLRAQVDSYHLVFFVDTLEYLQRGGRIGRAASLLGTLLQLKPMLRIDEGQIVPYERTRTRTRAIEGLRAFVSGWPAPISRIGVLYSTELDVAERLAAEMVRRVPADRITIAQFSPVLGTHVGPGAMGICIAEAVTD